MIPERIGVKYFVENPEAVNLTAIVPVFQRWIQEKAVEGLLIDVVDYQHVYQGPGILLIAHEGDYALDMSDGHPGLLYKRKRDIDGSLAERLHRVIGLSFLASQLLEVEASLSIRFRYDQAEITFYDRLLAPNHVETWESWQTETVRLIGGLYGKDANIQAEYSNDDLRYPLRIRVTATGVFKIDTLRNRLQSRELIAS